MKPHKHAELIKAWADGAEIQYRDKHEQADWDTMNVPYWNCDWIEFRIKPEPKPNIVAERFVYFSIHEKEQHISIALSNYPNCRFIFDGETGKLKSAEVL